MEQETENNSNDTGRPTIYNREYNERAKDYVANYKSTGAVVPTIVGLSLYLEIARSTIYEWEELYTEFSDTLAHLRAMYEHELLNNGLKGSFKPQITKLLLMNCGYHEAKEVDHKSSDGSMSDKGGVHFYDASIELPEKDNDD